MRKLYQSKKLNLLNVLAVLMSQSFLLKKVHAADFTLNDEMPDLSGFFGSIYNIVLPLAVTIGIFLIISGGYMFMTSQGDPQKVSAAKENLTSAIMGLLFVVLSIAILRIIFGDLITGVTPGF